MLSPSLDSQPHARVLPDTSLFSSLNPCRVLDLPPAPLPLAVAGAVWIVVI